MVKRWFRLMAVLKSFIERHGIAMIGVIINLVLGIVVVASGYATIQANDAQQTKSILALEKRISDVATENKIDRVAFEKRFEVAIERVEQKGDRILERLADRQQQTVERVTRVETKVDVVLQRLDPLGRQLQQP